MDKNTKVLALKYRPTNFDELIGQEVVAETITNSIRANKIPNAYLFTGIRGVGKTTIARIVAKALNCKNGIEGINDRKSCENCICESISNSNHIDVLELNGADKTSINDIRDLIEFSRYRPTSSKYKIFIIDEVHQISSSAFNALLKILEEPPEYLKFILATTEVKKVPVTILSRCQRFDLTRIKTSELFSFIKKIKDKENGNISDEALRLIVKISEGSVRDALSLLDRALLTLDKNKQLGLVEAQKIFGYFDKSQLIDLFYLILKGEEKKVIEIYRKIYDQGVEPKVFITDFLEIIYYFKNINSLTLESTNFSLNDEEFSKIKEISDDIENQVLILFWQFTIKTLDELDIVSNQNLSVEMFLVRLVHLSGIKNKDDTIKKKNLNNPISTSTNLELRKDETIDQIKNITQEKKSKPKIQLDVKGLEEKQIVTFKDLLEVCIEKKEAKLKYELEKNVNLVKFEKNIIEISFNENLDKNFVKDLSLKLLEWTGERWIISFSKIKGEISIKDKEKNKINQLLDSVKNTKIYNNIIKKFPDANLTDVEVEKKKDDK